MQEMDAAAPIVRWDVVAVVGVVVLVVGIVVLVVGIVVGVVVVVVIVEAPAAARIGLEFARDGRSMLDQLSA